MKQFHVICRFFSKNWAELSLELNSVRLLWNDGTISINSFKKIQSTRAKIFLKNMSRFTKIIFASLINFQNYYFKINISKGIVI